MRDKIIELLLAEKSHISGQEIGNLLGVSRAAVWKNIKKLREEGYEVESVSNKGYKIISTPNKVIKEELKFLLKDCQLIDEIHCYDTIDSTNKRGKELSVAGVKSALIISDEQTEGKGRRGRQWVSTKGEGIYMSLMLRPEIKPENASLLTLLAGLAVTEAIDKLTDLSAYIKWPNDVVIDSKKVAGILTEMSSEIDYVNHVIIGIGINVDHSVFHEDLVSKATSIKMQSKEKLSRPLLIQSIIMKFEGLYLEFMKTETLSFIIDEYNNHCINVGNEVRVVKNKEEIIGRCMKINSNGALVINHDEEIIEITSGEVSVRGIYGYV